MPDAAAVVLGLDRAVDAAAARARQRALMVLVLGQGDDGGWGLYMSSASEPFDTAVALLALNALEGDESLGRPAFSGDDRSKAIVRGRRFLAERQRDDGSWPETTRPARQESYAQRISTAGWATLALLATAPN